MKRDLDLMRDLLIQVEEALIDDNSRYANPWRMFSSPGKLSEVVNYHVRLLLERGLFYPESIKLDGQDEAGRPAAKFLPDALTDQGHDFLGLIRDDSIWQKTKDKLVKISGSTALDVVGEIAKRLALGIVFGGAA